MCSLVGDEGLVGTWIHGAFNMTGVHRKLYDLLIDPYVDEDLYRDMLTYFGARVASLVPQPIAAGCDFLSVRENMASGSMAGPKLFEQSVMPYGMKLIDAIHKSGGKVIYHNCGDARFLLPLYGRRGINIYESLTAEPCGVTALADALRQIPLPTVLSGGIDQIQFLKTATPAQARERVREVLDAVKPRSGFILAASDYFSESPRRKTNRHSQMPRMTSVDTIKRPFFINFMLILPAKKEVIASFFAVYVAGMAGFVAVNELVSFCFFETMSS